MRAARSRIRRGTSAKLSAPIVLLLLFASAAVAEDRVTIRGEGGTGKAVLSGRVVEWTGGLLRLRQGEELREIHADRIVDVETTRLKSHIDGLAQFESGKPSEAATLLGAALKDEQREWMRREILAALVRAELALGHRASATRYFLAIQSSDPTTRHYRIIPLDWTTTPPDATTAGEARSWLRSASNQTAKLLGASLLLFDENAGADAAQVLDELAAATDPRIFTLARAQLWRRTLARGAVPDGEIARWEDRVTEIPEPLRGGPWYLIGRAWSDVGNPERAAAAFLWLPLVYDADPTLAAEAARMAADELAKIGRVADAVVLYREVTTRFPSVPSAEVAKTRLERLAAEARARQATP